MSGGNTSHSTRAAGDRVGGNTQGTKKPYNLNNKNQPRNISNQTTGNDAYILVLMYYSKDDEAKF